MKKKMVAIFLVLVLSLVTMAGCSSAEINYLNMSKDILAEKGAEVEGHIDIKIDYDEIVAYMTEKGFYDDTEEDKAFLDTIKKYDEITLGFDGEIQLEDSIGYVLGMYVTIGGEKVDFGDVIFDATKGIYVSTDFLTGIIEIMNVFETSDEGKKFTEIFLKEIKSKMGETEYISLMSQDEMDIMAIMDMSNMSYSEIFGQDEVDLITTMFKNFSTDTVTQSGDSIKVSLNLEELGELTIRMLDYIASNQEDFIEAIVAYISTDKFTGLGLTEEDIDEAVTMMKENNSMVKNVIIQLKAMIEMIITEEAFKEFDDSSYVMTTSKISKGIKATEDLKVIANGKTLLTMTSDSSSIAKEVDVKIPSNAKDIVSLANVFNETINDINPINKAEINWYSSEDGYAEIKYERAGSGAYWSNMSNFSYEMLEVKDKSIYLPLRSISEAFGEEVGWDIDTKKAFIVKDGEKIAMEGMLVYDEYAGTSYTLVKIRDFEKLGYKVDYTFHGNDIGHTAVLTK